MLYFLPQRSFFSPKGSLGCVSRKRKSWGMKSFFLISSRKSVSLCTISKFLFLSLSLSLSFSSNLLQRQFATFVPPARMWSSYERNLPTPNTGPPSSSLSLLPFFFFFFFFFFLRHLLTNLPQHSEYNLFFSNTISKVIEKVKPFEWEKCNLLSFFSRIL